MCSYFPWPCCSSLSNHHLARDTTIIQISTPCNADTDLPGGSVTYLYFNVWHLAGLPTHGLNFSCRLTWERVWTGVKDKLFKGSVLPASHFCEFFHASPALRLPQPSIMTSRPSLHVLPPNHKTYGHQRLQRDWGGGGWRVVIALFLDKDFET